MNSKRTHILVLAGYDPSGGAGILADVKTAENNGVYAHAVCTAVTFQNSKRVTRIDWFTPQDISRQIALCCEDACFEWVKIGAVQGPEMFRQLLDCLDRQRLASPERPGARAKVIWDPILVSSSGTPFMTGLTAAAFEAFLPRVFMVTPNLPELLTLYPGEDPQAVCRRLSAKTAIYLKGGHDDSHPGQDRLFLNGKCHVLPAGRVETFAKHGSGCVLSAALTANLALAAAAEFPEGAPVGTTFGTRRTDLSDSIVREAATRSKHYTEAFLSSSPGLLGTHRLCTGKAPEGTKKLRFGHLRSQYPLTKRPSVERLQFITLDGYRVPPVRQVRLACEAGVKWVQLRMKDTAKAVVLEAAKEARRICDDYGARLIINDHPDIALQSGADGVHLGQNDMPVAAARELATRLIIGGTANTPEQALDMIRQGADYIGVGPFRFTTTKKNLSPVLGLKGIEVILHRLRLEGLEHPVIAVGGITAADLEALLTLPVHGIAISGTIARAAEPAAIIEKMNDSFNQRKTHKRKSHADDRR